MINSVSNQLIPKGRQLFFNEELHKYTDEFENVYTSVTTLIGKYIDEFKANDIADACAKIGRNPNHPNYEKYKGKTAKQLKYEWEQETKRACEQGTKKHNFLEDVIKASNNYKKNATGFINDKIYTIDNIISKHNYGKVNLNYFVDSGLKEKYPKIYGIIKSFVDAGWSVYAEIGVYDYKLLLSGLIDILLVKGDRFMILDWKTNKAPIRFEAGYYIKNNRGMLDFDDEGNILNEYRFTNKYFHAPLDTLEDSVGNHYAMQLSTYAHLVESFGFKCAGIILCHIRTIPEKRNMFDIVEREEFEVVDVIPMPYIKSHVENMINHYSINNLNTLTHNLFV